MMHRFSILLLLLATVTFSACSDSASKAPDTQESASADADIELPDASPDSPDAAATDASTSDAPVPTTPDALFAFLQSRIYTEYARESAPHASVGPHSTVRTFVNDALFDSLTAGNSTHPVGAAAIKELHGGDGVSGWAVSVKIAAGNSTNSWYWYEVFSTTNGDDPIEGIGFSGCANCHKAGEDHFLSSFPLQ